MPYAPTQQDTTTPQTDTMPYSPTQQDTTTPQTDPMPYSPTQQDTTTPQMDSEQVLKEILMVLMTETTKPHQNQFSYVIVLELKLMEIQMKL